jgi:hypothetical protein
MLDLICFIMVDATEVFIRGAIPEQSLQVKPCAPAAPSGLARA